MDLMVEHKQDHTQHYLVRNMSDFFKMIAKDLTEIPSADDCKLMLIRSGVTSGIHTVTVLSTRPRPKKVASYRIDLSELESTQEGFKDGWKETLDNIINFGINGDY